MSGPTYFDNLSFCHYDSDGVDWLMLAFIVVLTLFGLSGIALLAMATLA